MAKIVIDGVSDELEPVEEIHAFDGLYYSNKTKRIFEAKVIYEFADDEGIVQTTYCDEEGGARLIPVGVFRLQQFLELYEPLAIYGEK